MKKVFLKISQYSQENTSWSLFLQLYSKDTPTQVLFCEYCKILKNAYFEEHLRMSAPEYRFLYHFKVLFKRPHFNVVLSTKERSRRKRCKNNVDL